jgi:hypothetical protein
MIKLIVYELNVWIVYREDRINKNTWIKNISSSSEYEALALTSDVFVGSNFHSLSACWIALTIKVGTDRLGCWFDFHALR